MRRRITSDNQWRKCRTLYEELQVCNKLLVNRNQLQCEKSPTLLLIRTAGTTCQWLTCELAPPEADSQQKIRSDGWGRRLLLPLLQNPKPPSALEPLPLLLILLRLSPESGGPGSGYDEVNWLWVSGRVSSLSGRTDLLVRGGEPSLHSPSYSVSSACCWGRGGGWGVHIQHLISVCT